MKKILQNHINKKIMISVIAGSIFIAGLGFWKWIDVQEKEMQSAKISEYCQDVKIDVSLNGYNIEDGINPYLKTKVVYPKFDSVYVDVPGLHYKENISDEIKKILTQLCSENKSDVINSAEVFWYDLNDGYSVAGFIERKIPTCIGERCPADPVKFVIIKNETSTIVHSFSFFARQDDFRKYKKVTDKDIKEIIKIILEDNTKNILQ